MADTASPIFGVVLPGVGASGRDRPFPVTANPKPKPDWTKKGPKPKFPDQQPRRVVIPIRPRSPAPISGINEATDALLYDFVQDYLVSRGKLPRPNQPVDPGPLPDPIMEPVPIEIQPPSINLPIDLPEVIVSPPAPSVPSVPTSPGPIGDPLEEIIVSPAMVPNVGIPNVPRPGSRPAPSTRSAPRSNPFAFINPLASVLLGLNPFAGVAGANALNLAGNPSPISRVGTRPAPRPQPSLPELPWSPTGPSPSINPKPALNLGLNLANQPNPQQQNDKCKCKEEKKKERKPRPPRTVCYRGTYTQRTRGISYSRGKQVPCEGSTKAPGGAASSLLGFAGGLGGFLSTGDWNKAISVLSRKAKKLVKAKVKREKKATKSAAKKARKTEAARKRKVLAERDRDVKAIRAAAKRAREKIARAKRATAAAARRDEKRIRDAAARKKKAAVKAARAIKPVKVKLPKRTTTSKGKRSASNDHDRNINSRGGGQLESVFGFGF